MSALNVMPLPITTVTGLGVKEEICMFHCIMGRCTAPNVTTSRTREVLDKTMHAGNANEPSGSMWYDSSIQQP